jgi:hypothetical protein
MEKIGQVECKWGGKSVQLPSIDATCKETADAKF